jgi:hypothetical protein
MVPGIKKGLEHFLFNLSHVPCYEDKSVKEEIIGVDILLWQSEWRCCPGGFARRDGGMI